jgi:ESS family glutamate:Na+ symporter
MELDSRQTLILAVLVLFLGRFLNNKITLLQRYTIPDPVTGGIIASAFFSIIYFLTSNKIEFSLHQRDILLIVFFTCVGLSARFSNLLQGGKALISLLIIAVCYLFIQNITGLAVSQVTTLATPVGVLGSSVSLSGGHGTAIAWAPIFAQEYGIENAMEIGIACATFGLILGGICGGPIASFFN